MSIRWRAEQRAFATLRVAMAGPTRQGIRLVGIDVDGTLVGHSGVVAPIVWQAVQTARAAGIRLALCSGRPAFGIALEYARQLDSAGWHIFQNGSSVVDLATNRSRSAPIAQDVIAELVARARDSHQLLELYSDRDWAVESTSEWAYAHATLLGVPLATRAFEALGAPVVRAQWLLGERDAQDYIAAPHPQLEIAHATSPLMPDTHFIGLTARGVSKGSALRSVAEAYGISLEDTMYIGDAGNDLPALTIAGHPVAMQDASPAVLALARHVVGRAEDGGVAQALGIAMATSSRG